MPNTSLKPRCKCRYRSPQRPPGIEECRLSTNRCRCPPSASPLEWELRAWPARIGTKEKEQARPRCKITFLNTSRAKVLNSNGITNRSKTIFIRFRSLEEESQGSQSCSRLASTQVTRSVTQLISGPLHPEQPVSKAISMAHQWRRLQMIHSRAQKD
jgi:hypothetical protein